MLYCRCMKYITAFLLALVVLPTVALGGALWSQQSVTETYETRVVAIDAELEELTTREAELAISFSEVYYSQYNAERYAARMEIAERKAQLLEEKRILEVAYWLINESF